MLFLFASLALAASPALDVPGGRISVQFEKFKHAASDDEVLAFIARSADPVLRYYGKFPVPKLEIDVKPNRYARGAFGREFHGRRIDLYLGPELTADRLHDDQILTHEMFHLGFPDLANDYAWVEEGLATYLAHLNRARVGQTTEEEFWKDAREGFGDALAGGSGFADEESYHRIYWGGALFWFEIDLEIRVHSKGAKSLDTVTRAILASGGTNAHKWSIPKLQRAVDKAAGFPVFQKWYDFFGPKPAKVDLDALWKRLGIENGTLKENALRASLMKNVEDRSQERSSTK